MPIIIDEIIISVEVTNNLSAGGSSALAESGTQQIIVEQCVERVLEILRQRAPAVTGTRFRGDGR
jgi:hypothetical protein